MTLLIDTYEGRDVGIFDILGAYLQAKITPKTDNERVLIKFVEDFVDITCEVNPELEKNVIYGNGRKVLYMKVLQVIYGCIESGFEMVHIVLRESSERGLGNQSL